MSRNTDSSFKKSPEISSPGLVSESALLQSNSPGIMAEVPELRYVLIILGRDLIKKQREEGKGRVFMVSSAIPMSWVNRFVLRCFLRVPRNPVEHPGG